MHRKAVILVVVAVAAAAVGFGVWRARAPKASDPEALALLRAAAAPRDTVTLSGEARVIGGGPQAPQRLSVDQKGDRMRMADGSGVVVDDGRDVYRLDPGTRTAQRYRAADVHGDLERLAENYVVTSGGRAEVAGRKATVIVMRRRGGGVARRLWLDGETGVVLRQETYDERGRVLNGMAFERVDFGAEVPESAFEVPDGWEIVEAGAGRSEEPVPLDELSERVGFEVKAPGYVPQGFTQIGAHARQMGRHAVPAAELRYGDGRRRFSVYEHARTHDAGQGMAGQGRHGWRHGAPEGRGRAMGLQGGRAARAEGEDRVVVVVGGDLTPQELARVADSVK